MKPELHKLIESLKHSIEQENKDVKANKVFTISSVPGAGAKHIIDIISKRLKMDVYDKNIINEFAEFAGTDKEAFTMIAEDSGHAKDFWLYRMFGGGEVSHETIRRHLSNVMYALARSGNCIIVGRGGHIPLADIATIRVRVTASYATCIKRIMQQEGVDTATAASIFKKSSASSGKFVWNIFNSRLNDPINFDMVINTDRCDDFEHYADIITSTAGKIRR